MTWVQEAVQAGLLCWLYYVCRRDYHDLWSKARFFFSVFPFFQQFFSLFQASILNRQASRAFFPNAALVVSDSGTKAAPLLGSGNRGYYSFLIETYQLHLPSYSQFFIHSNYAIFLYFTQLNLLLCLFPKHLINISFTLLRIIRNRFQKPNSWTYNFIDVSGHNIESSQTWGVWEVTVNSKEENS